MAYKSLTNIIKETLTNTEKRETIKTTPRPNDPPRDENENVSRLVKDAAPDSEDSNLTKEQEQNQKCDEEVILGEGGKWWEGASKFSSLAHGSKFNFAQPHLGAKGPWKKTGDDTYRHADDKIHASAYGGKDLKTRRPGNNVHAEDVEWDLVFVESYIFDEAYILSEEELATIDEMIEIAERVRDYGAAATGHRRKEMHFMMQGLGKSGKSDSDDKGHSDFRRSAQHGRAARVANNLAAKQDDNKARNYLTYDRNKKTQDQTCATGRCYHKEDADVQEGDEEKIATVGTARPKTKVEINPVVGQNNGPIKEEEQIEERSDADEARDFHRTEADHHNKIMAASKNSKGPFGAYGYHEKKWKEHLAAWEKLNKKPVMEGEEELEEAVKMNPLSTYHEAGSKAAKARKQGDESTSKFHSQWARKAFALEKDPDHYDKAKGAFNDGYSGRPLKEEQLDEKDAPKAGPYKIGTYTSPKPKPKGIVSFTSPKPKPLKEEQLDELSRNTLSNYQVKAMYDKRPSIKDRNSCATGACPIPGQKTKGLENFPRRKGIKQAADRLQGTYGFEKNKYKMEDVMSPEEAERIDELSKKTLVGYVQKAAPDIAGQSADYATRRNREGIERTPRSENALRKGVNRIQGVQLAAKKLAEDQSNQASPGVETIELPHLPDGYHGNYSIRKMYMEDRRKNRLAKNEVIRQANKEKFSKPSPFSPITTQVMHGVAPKKKKGPATTPPKDMCKASDKADKDK